MCIIIVASRRNPLVHWALKPAFLVRASSNPARGVLLLGTEKNSLGNSPNSLGNSSNSLGNFLSEIPGGIRRNTGRLPGKIEFNLKFHSWRNLNQNHLENGVGFLGVLTQVEGEITLAPGRW